MFRMTSRAALAATVGLAMWIPSVASAAPAGPLAARSLEATQPKTTQVQYRRGWHGGRGYGHRHWHGHRRGIGPGLAFGLATGAILGGAIAAQQAPVYGAPAPAYGDGEAYCASRFRSYDPASGTYLGYDGLRHPCP